MMEAWSTSYKRYTGAWKWILICILCFFLIGSVPVMSASSQINEPRRTEILLISNGVTPQELALENYIENFSAYNLTTLKDSAVNATTDFSPYDIIILTGFASAFSPEGFQKIKDSNIPILVIEYSTFHLAHRLGLISSEIASAEMATHINSAQAGIHDLTWILGMEPEVYRSPSSLYTVPSEVLADSVVPIVLGPSGQAVVALDREQGILVSGLSELHQNTVNGWFLFDLLLRKLHVSGPIYTDHKDIPRNFLSSGLNYYLTAMGRRRRLPPLEEVRGVIWEVIVKWNLFELLPYFNFRARALDPMYVVTEGDIRQFYTDRPLPHHERCGHAVDEISGVSYSKDLWFVGQSVWGDFHHTSDSYPLGCSGFYYPDCPTCNPNSGILQDYGNPIYGDLNEGTNYWDLAGVDEVFTGDFDTFINWINQNQNGIFGPKHYINSYTVRGVDLGANANLYGRTFFYFGDTWGWRGDCSGCASDAFRNDAIAVSTDTDPTDGIDATIVLEDRQGPPSGINYPDAGMYGMNITGVHEELEDFMDGFWANREAGHSITSTAAQIPPIPIINWKSPPGNRVSVHPGMVLSWYTTASQGSKIGWNDEGSEKFLKFTPNSNITCDFNQYFDENTWNTCLVSTNDCDGSVPASRLNPLGWLGCSYDGITFRNCYSDEDFDVPLSVVHPPFSGSYTEWGVCEQTYKRLDYIEDSNFVGGTPLYISGNDFRTICNEDPGNSLCTFYTERDKGGVLIYGNGRPLTASPLYLAYIEYEDLKEGKRWEQTGYFQFGTPVAYYYSTSDGTNYWWGFHEISAAALPAAYWGGRTPPCRDPEQIYAGVPEWTEEEWSPEEGKYGIAAFLEEYYDYDDDGKREGAFESKLDDSIIDQCESNEELAKYLLWYKHARRMKTCSALWDEQYDETAFHFSPETCLPTSEDQKNMIGVNSAIIIREPADQPPRILLLSHYSDGMWGDVVHSYHWSWLDSPWDIKDGVDLNDPITIPGQGAWMNDIDGYGTYIINGQGDEYIKYDEEKGILNLWITVSAWWGPPKANPYGIYTKPIKIEWPPS